ncbi:MAG: M23 family metallopeptidase [Alphaproteobacteria bacterium]|nr:M23 family metallopeptidase [Alphaproteobacteria bacterium]
MIRVFARCLIAFLLLFFLNGCGVSSASFLASLKPKEHTVRAKETVFSLSRKYKVPTRTIIEANDLTAPYFLKKGQVIKIPLAQVHTVKKGETLYGIAKVYGVDFSSLARQNKIKSPWTLSVGQHLYLPATLTRASDNQEEKKKAVSLSVANATGARPKDASSKPKYAKINIPSAPSPSGQFMWPVNGSVISGFGIGKNGKRNDGINIASTKGTQIKAAENGVVAYVGDELKGFGNLLLLKHKDGWITAYAHADSFSVKKGETVKKGEVIGVVGSSGNVKTPQLHFEIRKGTKASNPMNYLKS